jgi:hypothetical protein
VQVSRPGRVQNSVECTPHERRCNWVEAQWRISWPKTARNNPVDTHRTSVTNGPLSKSLGTMVRMSMTSFPRPELAAPSSLSPRRPASLTTMTQGDALSEDVSTNVRNASCTDSCTRGCSMLGISSSKTKCFRALADDSEGE